MCCLILCLGLRPARKFACKFTAFFWDMQVIFAYCTKMDDNCRKNAAKMQKIIGIKCQINGRNWMTSRTMDETGKERPHMHERHTNAISRTKKRAIGSRLIKASKLSQIGEFFFNLAHLWYSNSAKSTKFASIWRSLVALTGGNRVDLCKIRWINSSQATMLCNFAKNRIFSNVVFPKIFAKL